MLSQPGLSILCGTQKKHFEAKETVLIIYFFINTIEVETGYQHSSKNLLLCSTEESHTSLEQHEGWLNDDRIIIIIIFWMDYPFNFNKNAVSLKATHLKKWKKKIG